MSDIAELVEQKKIEEKRAEAYEKMIGTLLLVYAELFPNYIWTDPKMAITVMAEEIRSLRGKVVGAWRR